MASFHAASPLAQAEDVVVGYGEAAQGYSYMQGGLDNEFFNQAFSRAAVGLRYRRFALGVGFTRHALGARDTDRHGLGINDDSFGPELKVFLGESTGFRGYFRAAVARHWMSGTSAVVRQCGDFGVCDAGFFIEEPDYSGLGARAAVGVEYLMLGPAQRNTLVAFSAELGYEQLRFKVVDEPVNGGMIGISISISVGGGRIIPYEPVPNH